MKRYKFIYALMLAATAGLASCSDDFTEPPVPIPDGGLGTGTWDNPLSATQARLGTINYQHNPAWVRGYLVGVVNTEISNTCSAQSADFVAPFGGSDYNLLIADDPEPFRRLISYDENGMEAEYNALLDSLLLDVASVQLPSSMREVMGLAQNPSAQFKQVCLLGTTGDTYLGIHGVKGLQDFNFGETGKEPSEPLPVEPVGKFFQNFTSTTSMAQLERQGWKNYSVQGGLEGWKVTVTDDNIYVGANAFHGYSEGGPYEQWLVTPPIDLELLPEKSLEFLSSALTQADGSRLEVYALSEQDPSTASRVQLPAVIAQAPASGTSDWVSSEKISLDGLSGIVYIGWRYIAEQGGVGRSTTFCIDDVNVGNCPPPADWTKAEQIYYGLDQNDTEGADDWEYENLQLPSNISRIWSWRTNNGLYYLNASAYIGGKNYASKSIAYYGTIDCTGYINVGVSFDHAARFQTTIPQLGRVVVREAGTTEWTEYLIPAWPSTSGWIFSSSGIIDLTDFAGKKIEVGVKYESTDQGADTWEVRNFSVIGVK